MKKRLLILFTCAVSAIVLALAVLVIANSFRQPDTPTASGNLTLVRREDSQLILSWPQMPSADHYQVKVLKGEQLLFEQRVESGLECSLPDLPQQDVLTVRVEAIQSGASLHADPVALEATAVMAPPVVEEPVRTVDTQAKTVHLQFKQQPNSTVQLYLHKTSQDRELFKTVLNGELTISFGESGDFTVPVYGEDLVFSYVCSKSVAGMDLYWHSSEPITVSREDFLDRELHLELIDAGNNRFSLHWNETKGDHQLLQLWNEQTQAWETVRKYGHQDRLSYDTGYLPKYGHYTYRVIGVGGQTLPDSQYSTQPETVEMTTGASVLFATIWPIQTLDVYSDADGKTVIGSAPEGKAFTVKQIRNGMFQIRYEGEKLGYVDSNYCMINLPDYMGDRCLYQISNSFDSKYMIHNYGVPEVTGGVTIGYEHVKQINGDYLVPLLYPTAKKLEAAATAALEQGYQLKIYDSFRPHKTTKALYYTVSAMLNDLLPPVDHYGIPQPENASMTYSMLITDNGRYNLSFFLAKDGSKHNLGVALDLTLVDMSTGEEIEAQTEIHDLSWYSERGRNNASAKTLSNIMTQAGFGTLISEWWHFQDTDTIRELDLNNFLATGVSAECWVVNELGWRYRNANGSFITGCTTTIDGISYRFDAQGYATAAGK